MKFKIALITGGAKRIGKEITEHLVKNNWKVVIHYNKSEKEAIELKKKLPKGSTFLLQQDFSSDFCEKKFFEDILSLTNNQKPKLLINNASSFDNDNINTFKAESLLNQIRVNCIAPILLSREFTKNNKNSNIINILDLYAFENSKNFTSHQISKASLLKATKQMALEFANNTRVNSITPSFVIKNDSQNKEVFYANIKNSLLKKGVTPQDICNSIDFIINTESITGENIILDCGRQTLSY